jgi:ubiquinone/menaquinone biosynthesis C-methylase UbiE
MKLSALGRDLTQTGVMRRVWHAFGLQLQHPAGLAGSIAGWLMGLVNDEPNRLAIHAMELGPGDTVLELGFGPGRGLRAIAARTRGPVYGVDHSVRMLQQAKELNETAVARGRMMLVHGPFSPLPWIDGTFDKILLVNVVYFFDPAGQDIAEVYRVLRPGGRVVIYATSRDTMRNWPFAGPETHRTFDAEDVAELLDSAGFSRSHTRIEHVELAFGVKGLIAVAEKTARSIGGNASGARRPQLGVLPRSE